MDIKGEYSEMVPEQTVIQAMSERIGRAKSEADVRAELEGLIRQTCEDKGWHLPLHSTRDRTRIEATRTDTLFGQLVIRYVQPGKLKTSVDASGNRENIKRLTTDIISQSTKGKQGVAGILTDGRIILFLQPRRGKLIPTDPQPISPDALRALINLVQALCRKTMSADEFIRDFGPESKTAQHGVNTLLTKVMDVPSPKTEMMFREWNRIFDTIHGEENHKETEKSRMLTKLYNIDKRIQLRPLLFSIHTYCALLTKLLATEFLCQMKNRPSLTDELILLDESPMKDKLVAFEDGEYFASLGMKDFVKGNLFSWYADAWDKNCADMVRDLCETLNQYEQGTVLFSPRETCRLLKTFNQCLIPLRLRHDLGEYSTPEWLAERLLNQVGYDGNPDKRILDPCCGTGTFLILSIDRLHQFVDDHFGRYPDKAVVLDKLIHNIVGFDLNPLSVITARTNYLFALGDLLEGTNDDLHIPVYLADSIRVPAEQTELFFEGYFLHTAAGNLSIPAEIVKVGNVPKVTSVLQEGVRLQSGVDIFLERTKRSCELNDEDFDRAEPGLTHLYRTMLDLDRKGKNRFWMGIIENAFAPVLIEPFDFIAGSPPWVSWENLTMEYRKATHLLWSKYELQAKSGGVKFELGKQKRDLVILFTFISIDSYLKEKGRVAFLIPKSVLKNEGGEAFRRFQLDENTPIKVVHVDDLDELQPIENATMKPCVIVLQKGTLTNYPVPFTLWRRSESHTFSPGSSLDEVIEATQRVNLYAKPVEEENIVAPWITARSKTLNALQKMTGISDYHSRSGISTWANGVYLVRIIEMQPDNSIVIENLHDIGKKSIPKIRKAVEPQLLFPVLRGQEISKWQHRSRFHLIFPHEQGTADQPINQDAMEKLYPKTFAYLKEFEDILSSRSGYTRLRKGLPFYTIGNATSPTFADFKVVWTKSGKEISCCVIGDRDNRSLGRKTIIPFESVTMVPFEKQEEAHYFCALMNSSLLQVILKTYFFHPSGGSGSPTILEHIYIPRFNPSKPVHRELAELSLQAHRLISLRHGEKVDPSATEKKEGLFLKELEEEIDKKAARFWDFSEEDLVEMKRSLRELS